MAFADLEGDGDLDLVWGADARCDTQPFAPTVFFNQHGDDDVAPRVEHPRVLLSDHTGPAAIFRVRITDRVIDLDEITAELDWVVSGSVAAGASATGVSLRYTAPLTYQVRLSCADLRAGFAAGETVASFTGEVRATDAAGNVTTLPLTPADNLAAAFAGDADTLLLLDILEPTQFQPAVLPADEPAVFLVRLRLEPVTFEPEPGDFEIRVGGQPATAVSAERVGQEIWLAVSVPSTPAGLADLEVGYRLCDRLAEADTRSNAVDFGDPSHTDSVLVVDVSGSMDADGKLDSAINAANLFLSTLRDGDRTGVVRYSSALAGADFVASGIGPVAGGAVDAARTALGGFVADGGTPLGQGLLEGLGQLDIGTANDVRALVLLSDGKENRNPKWPTVRDTFATPPNQAVEIHTVSLGPDANHDLMREIANELGEDPPRARGRHRQVDVLPTQETVAALDSGIRLADLSNQPDVTLAHRLANAYEHVHNDISYQQRLWQGAVELGPILIQAPGPARHEEGWALAADSGGVALAQRGGGGQRVDISVEPGLERMTLAVNWTRNERIEVGLAPPAGQPPAAITRVDGPTNTVFHVDLPWPGTWGVDLRGAEGTDVLVTLSGESTARGFVRTPVGRTTLYTENHAREAPDLPPAGSPVPIGLMLLQGDQAVAGAEVTVRAFSDAHGLETLALRDDGAAPDTTAGDGIYVGTLGQTRFGGPIGAEITARWTDSGGVGRARIFPLTVVLDALDTDGDTIPDLAEERLGLDPGNPFDAFDDPDADGAVTWREWEVGLDPFDPDTDDGGQLDGFELCVGSDPELARDDADADRDDDGDGLPDLWEMSVGLDPTDAGDAAGDPDADGLDTRKEFELCTDPRNPDTDGDTVPDGVEVDRGTDPRDPLDRVPPDGKDETPGASVLGAAALCWVVALIALLLALLFFVLWRRCATH